MLMKAASDEHGWDLDLGRIAKLWRAGCIIRARFSTTSPPPSSAARQPDGRRVLRRRPVTGPGGLAPGGVGGRGGGDPGPAYATALCSTTRSGRPTSPPTSSRLSATTSAPTPTSGGLPRGEFFHTDWLGGGTRRPPELRARKRGSRRRGSGGRCRPRRGEAGRFRRRRHVGNTLTRGAPRTGGRRKRLLPEHVEDRLGQPASSRASRRSASTTWAPPADVDEAGALRHHLEGGPVEDVACAE